MAKRHLFHGTMNASKSAQLLMQVYNLERQGKTFLIFKPAIDTRDKDVVKSRALDEERPAISIKRDELGIMMANAYEILPDFVFVDELQFFTGGQVEELDNIARELGIPIFSYGLLISYTGELFEGSKRAIECGWSLHELKMQCDYCKNKSTHHLLYIGGKLVKSGNGIHVGDQEFKSVCRDCYVNECKK